jgi:hypothetical protein
MAFGICWAVLFIFTNVGLALGHPVDEDAINPLKVLFWIELGAFVIGAAVFFRAEMKDPGV